MTQREFLNTLYTYCGRCANRQRNTVSIPLQGLLDQSQTHQLFVMLLAAYHHLKEHHLQLCHTNQSETNMIVVVTSGLATTFTTLQREYSSIFPIAGKWIPCYHSMVQPQFTAGRESLEIQRLAAAVRAFSLNSHSFYFKI